MQEALAAHGQEGLQVEARAVHVSCEQRRVDGLSLASAELDVDGNRHDTGWIHAWTGGAAVFSTSESRATHASLDQLVAEEVARTDRLPSLELALSGGGENGRPIAYASNGVQLPALTSPEAVWDRVFGPSVGGADQATRQRDVVDFAWAEYQATKGSLSALARDRLESHFGLLAQLGERIEGMASLTCDAPDRVAGLASYDERFDAMSELIAASFSCDVTRVISVSLGELPTVDPEVPAPDVQQLVQDQRLEVIGGKAREG